MSLDSATDLSIAEIAIYILMLPFILYIFFRHRFHGLAGWAYLLLFTGLRIGAAIIQITNHNSPTGTTTTGAILNSIGLSPLLLSLASIIHECSHHGVPNREAKFEVILQLSLHLLVIVGVALAAMGGSSLGNPETAKKNYHKDHIQQEVGNILLLLSSLFLVIYAAATYRGIRNGPKSYNSYPAPNRQSQALRLLYCVLGALPFAIIFAIYGVVFAFDHSRVANPVTGTFAVKFVLIFLVQTIAALLLVGGGLWTRHILGDEKRGQAETTAQADLEP